MTISSQALRSNLIPAVGPASFPVVCKTLKVTVDRDGYMPGPGYLGAAREHFRVFTTMMCVWFTRSHSSDSELGDSGSPFMVL